MMAMNEEVPQSIALTPQVSFAQVFATPKQLPLTTTPQLVLLNLLAHVTLSPAALRAVVSSQRLIPSLVRALASTPDDRFRSLALQTLADWLREGDDDSAEEGDVAQERAGNTRAAGRRGVADGDGDVGEEEPSPSSSSAAFTAADHAALVHRLLDAGLAGAITGCMRRSNSAPVLRDATACLLALLAPGGGGGGGGGGARGGAPGGHGPGRAHGGGPAGLTGVELPAGAALEGALRGRVRAELVKAGLVPALLEALGRPPSYWRYWLCINMGVVGARLLELQWWLLVVGRICLLPEAPAEDAAAGPAEGRAASHGGSSTSGGGGGAPSGGKRGTGKHSKRDRDGEREHAPPSRVTQWLAGAEQVLASPVLQVYAASIAGSGAAGGGSTAAGATAVVGMPAAASGKGQDGTAGAAAAASGGEGSSASGGEAEGPATAAEAGGRAQPNGPSPAAAAAAGSSEAAAPRRALALLSAAVAAVSRREALLPSGSPLALLPAAERNVTPDWRAQQRDRIRKAAEEARAAAAQASATSAVDVLSAAMAQL
ncbi:hypothetical protein GPECTOR_6g613 [Gonium pectorale]|uniref:Uncharacterized protein n=1 Tax=Gonium pectorale TaxID=33097 RepID=A0A150GUZ7_GONPE|nr:hypothetical protein GPECTOR_6g613 [Gonium pectorale]|eukprot:KXZ53696.1 hypothetical protein GPECTOR_6g613 [Gonium pectorale]